MLVEEFPVIDGYSLRKNYRCNMTFESMVVTQFEHLRRSGNFQQKQWAFPKNPFTQPIPARGISQQEFRVGIGTVLWGWTVSQPMNSEEAFGTITSIQFSDACTDEPFFSEPVQPTFGQWPGNQFFGWGGPILLPRLLTVGKPGTIVVDVATSAESPARQQVILYGAVPKGVNR